MAADVALLLAGLVLLAAGGESLVRGAARLARTLGISALVVGLTVVAFGTSTPELFVGLVAAAQDKHELLLGNVVGSNIANVWLVLGLAALMRPMKVALNLIKFDVPIMIFTLTAFMVLAFTGQLITRWEAGGLVTALVAYMCFTCFISRHEGDDVADEYKEGLAPAEKPGRALLLIVLGIVGLQFGAKFLVDSASNLATAFGISQHMIGLTIVAIGTSLPEIATSIIAVRRGQSDIAVGNIVGSNIFNILAVVGFSGLITPLRVGADVISRDGPVMLGAAVLMLPILRTGHIVSRLEGLLLVMLYVGYLTWITW